ncbi:MAG: cyclic beta 1-2 glucan synthetase, partial [Planctomycetes bacterium]|nr:cyclic beta 1-2 glucan synthetase [Planctomycetota bacterium]
VPWVYVLGQAVATAVAAGLLLLLARDLLTHGWAYLVPLGLALLVFVSQTAISVLNWLATLLVPVRTLPRMDFAKGIPPEHRALVVIPTLLGSPGGADALIENLEIRYLANRGPNLLLALLTDLPDAPQETLPGDDDLVGRAADAVRELNRKYAEPGQAIFYLLHRPRVWNPSEGVWMGRERKRGKLMDLNRLLREGEAGAFHTIVGDVEGLRGVRYVIPLDTDTQLPPETAAKMVGTLAHPLNRPQVSPRTGCVTLGYGVLQPRVAVALTGAARSLFARLYAGEVGIDPYTREVSNVYHDLFARSPFIGKGIYDLEAFDRAVRGRFPANRILSHDLIEGCYANCGFVGDVELIEDHPSRYLADIQRRHRWVRGDWQIAAWLLPRVPAARGRREANPLARLPRWMIFDNLRRSLQPLGFVALLVAGWLAVPEAQPAWTLWLLATFLAPEVLRMVWSLAVKPGKVLWAAHLRRAAATSGRQIVICLLHLAFLPFETLVHADAIARVAWRTLVSKRHLLEWQTAHDAEASARGGLLATACTMWIAPATAVAVAAALVVLRYPIPVAAGPLLTLWLASPILAWFISRPTRARPVRLSAGQVRFLRRLARRTWMYFEHFVGPSQNWLPPDNFQEQPSARVTERTSPTNIGLALASTLAAHDFGYLSAGQLLERVENTLTTLNRLRRYREHFVNWYDTWTLEPLRPAYISTVDSGNLAGCLVALGGGLLELAGAPLVPPRWREGIEDTAGVLAEEVEAAQARVTDPRRQAEIRA